MFFGFLCFLLWCLFVVFVFLFLWQSDRLRSDSTSVARQVSEVDFDT
jgi:hypothetical protein